MPDQDPLEQALLAVEQEESASPPPGEAGAPAGGQPAAASTETMAAGVTSIRTPMGPLPVMSGPEGAGVPLTVTGTKQRKQQKPDALDSLYQQVAAEEVNQSAAGKMSLQSARQMAEAARDQQHWAESERNGFPNPVAHGDAIRRAAKARSALIRHFQQGVGGQEALAQRMAAIPDVDLDVPDSRLQGTQNTKLYGQPFKINPRKVAEQAVREGYAEWLGRQARALALQGQFDDPKRYDPAQVPGHFADMVRSRMPPEYGSLAGPVADALAEVVWKRQAKETQREKPLYELAKKYISGEETDMDRLLDMPARDRKRFLGYVYEATVPDDRAGDDVLKSLASAGRAGVKIWQGLQGFAGNEFGAPPELAAERDRIAAELKAKGYNFPSGLSVTQNMPADVKKLVAGYHKAAAEVEKGQKRVQAYGEMRRDMDRIQQSKDPLVGSDWFGQAMIDTSASVPYMASYMAAGLAGPAATAVAMTALAASQAVEFQDSLREMGAEITPEVRGMSFAAGFLYQQIEKMQMEGLLLKSAPLKTASQAFMRRFGAYVVDKIKRHGVNYLTENAEEVLQQGTEWMLDLAVAHQDPGLKIDWEAKKVEFGKSIGPMLISIGMMVAPGAVVDVVRDYQPSVESEGGGITPADQAEMDANARELLVRQSAEGQEFRDIRQAVRRGEAENPAAVSTAPDAEAPAAPTETAVPPQGDTTPGVPVASTGTETDATAISEKPADSADPPTMTEAEAEKLAKQAGTVTETERADLAGMKTPELGKLAKELGVWEQARGNRPAPSRAALVQAIRQAQQQTAARPGGGTVTAPPTTAVVPAPAPVPAEAGPRAQPAVEAPKTPPGPGAPGVEETVEYKPGPRGEKSPPRFKTVWTQPTGQAGAFKPTEQMSHTERATALLTDRLTGVGSKRAWLEAAPRPFSALVNIDLKQQNDAPRAGEKSHVYGDHAVLATANALRRAFGAQVYRLGGGNFRVALDAEAGAAEKLEQVKGALGEIAGVPIKMGYQIGADSEHRPAVSKRTDQMKQKERQWVLTHDEMTELPNDVAFEETPRIGTVYRMGGDEFAVVAGDGVVALDINGLGMASRLFDMDTGDKVLMLAVEAMRGAEKAWEKSAAEGAAALTKALDRAIVRGVGDHGDVFTLSVEVAHGFGRTYEEADRAAGERKKARSGLSLSVEPGERGGTTGKAPAIEGALEAVKRRKPGWEPTSDSGDNLGRRAEGDAGVRAAPDRLTEPEAPAAEPVAPPKPLPPAPAASAAETQTSREAERPAAPPPLAIDTKTWAARIETEKKKLVSVRPAPEMGGARASWDALTGTLNIANNLTEAEAAAVESQAGGLMRLRLPTTQVTVELDTGKTAQVPALRTAREMGRRLDQMRKLLDCLRG